MSYLIAYILYHVTAGIARAQGEYPKTDAEVTDSLKTQKRLFRGPGSTSGRSSRTRTSDLKDLHLLTEKLTLKS